MRTKNVILLLFGILIILGGFGGLNDPEADALAVVSVFAIGALMLYLSLRSTIKKRVPRKAPTVAPTVAPIHQETTPHSSSPTEYTSTYTVIDTETTGLSADDRIVQFSALKVSDHKIVDRLELLINPQMVIPERVSKMHGITNDRVIGCPTFFDVSRQIIEFIGDDIIVGHNIQFDMRMINGELSRCGSPKLCNDTLDTMNMARLTLSTHNRKLSSICEELGIANQCAHDAGSDSMATHLCYEAMLPRAMVYSGIFEVDSPLWEAWNHEVHGKPERERMARASSCRPISISQDAMTGIFEGSNGEEYTTSISSCSCYDFQDRQKPCKHMYRLIAELRLTK